jgi:hypothetical protein
MNAYVHPSHSINETWYNLRSGLCLQALPTHENGYVGYVDEEREGSTGPVDNLKLINSNHSLHAPVTQVKLIKSGESWVKCIFVLCFVFKKHIHVCVCIYE